MNPQITPIHFYIIDFLYFVVYIRYLYVSKYLFYLFYSLRCPPFILCMPGVLKLGSGGSQGAARELGARQSLEMFGEKQCKTVHK